RTVDGRSELDAFLGDLAQTVQAEDLETARIGQNGLVPLHETMQPAVLFHDVGAGAQPQMEGIAQDDLRADLVEFMRQHGFYAAVSAYGHEDGRLDDAVIKGDLAPARGAVGG